MLAPMRALLPVVLLSLALVSCRGSDGAPGAAATSVAAGAPGFVVTEVKPAAGQLPAVLRAEVAKAKAQGLAPHVELTAGWCAPCRAIKTSLEDPRMKAAFKGTYIVQLD